MSATIPWGEFSEKHKEYIKQGIKSRFCVAEGAVRSGKTIDHCIMAAARLEESPDIFHLASGSTIGNAKLNIGVCNGFGLEALFRGRCHWGKYKDNEALFVRTRTGEKIIIFAGGGKADSYKRILGNSYGIWIATEINEHYDSPDSRTSFVKVASARQIAAVDPYTLWDLNPCNPQAPIYTDYIDKYRQTDMPGGYVYQHFTIHDNATVTPERLAQIEATYEPGTVWYRRDILGERAIAQGLIYQAFADNPDKFMVDPAMLDYSSARHYELTHAVIGVDFGGGTSAHAFCCTGFTRNGSVIVLDDYKCPDALDPERLAEDFVRFVIACKQRWLVTDVYCDSAEQTLINGLRTAAARARLGVNIGNALKRPINDRIRAACILMAAGRFLLSMNAKNTIDALKNAVWDPREITQDVRLDNGTSNIDNLDALEYTYERDIKSLIAQWS